MKVLTFLSKTGELNNLDALVCKQHYVTITVLIGMYLKHKKTKFWQMS